MELAKNVELDYANGELILKAKLKDLIVKELEAIKAKVESGEIDLIPGTDLDKMAIMTVIEALKAAV